jgi:isopentenyl phosphate kinase
VSGITKAGVYAEPGQTIHEIELPKDLQNTPLLDIHKGFRIDATGGIGRLVKR